MAIALAGCNNAAIVDKEKMDVDNKKQDVQEIIQVEEELVEESPPLLDSRAFINERSFYGSIDNKLSLANSGDIIAGILPHHDVACKYMSEFYKTIAEKKTPEIVIIIGPNHPGEGPRFQVGHYDFTTWTGVVKSHSDIINNLIQNPLMNLGITNVFEREHSVGIHMNYIHYYFEDTRVVPIIIGETRDNEGIVDVAKDIVEQIKDKDVLLIASIDFSHYLTLEEANKKDETTREILEQSDVNWMSGLGNDHIDSPSSYGLLIEILEQMGEKYSCIINGHDNSANIMGNEKLEETTSYFSVSYERVDNN